MVTWTLEERQVESTALWTAAVRAQEYERIDRLIDDPWAAALAGEAGKTWLAQRPPGSGLPMVLRTRYFDDRLMQITRDAAIYQVVLLAAGLDTRAFRLTWQPGTHLYELDKPAVLRYKAAVLDQAGAQPGCQHTMVEVDLTEPWIAQLLERGFESEQPSAWLIEGFLFYLPIEHIAQILDAVTELAAPGSWLGFDIVNSITLTSPWTRAWIEMQAKAGAPWIGTIDDPVTFLSERGWSAALTQAGAPDANHGRWTLPVIPPTAPDMPHNWFVTAQRHP